MSKRCAAAAASSNTLSKREVALLSPNSKQQYKEDQEQKKKDNAAGAKQLFSRPQKISKQKGDPLLSDYLTSTIQLQPLPLTTTDAKALDPSSERYNQYGQLAYRGFKIPVPSTEQMDEVDRAQAEYNKLKNMKPEPDDYLQRAAGLQSTIKTLAPEIKEQIQFLGDAVKAYHEAVTMRQQCKDNDELHAMQQWMNVVSALTCIGVADFIAGEIERRRQIREAADAAKKAADAAKKAAEAAAASARMDEDGVEIIDDSSGEECDVDSEQEDGNIKDSDGNTVPVTSVFKSGKKSARQKKVQSKKRSQRKDVKTRTGMNNTVGYQMTQKDFASWILKPWNYKNKRTGVEFQGENRKNHGLTLMKSTAGTYHLWCTFCEKAVSYKFQQHLGGDVHQQRHLRQLNSNGITRVTVVENETVAEAYSRFKDDAISQLETERKKNNLAGSELSTDLTRYRVDVLEHAYRANLSLSQLERMRPAIELHNPPAMTVGFARDLPRTVGRALTKALSNKLRWIIEQCYPHFGVIADGSPLGANAEAIIIRLLRIRDHCIIDILVSVRLFDGSLTGENIASNILSILTKFDLDPSHWRATMLDRASANIKAHKEILRLCPQYKPSLLPCLSHTFSLPGKEFKKTCTILDKFRKGYNGSIMFRGKLYLMLKKCWRGVTIIVAGGVRWYIEWEQIAQMDQMGIMRIVRDVIAKAEELELSSKSVAKMKEASQPHLLPRLIVECGAVAEVGRPFCLATYAAEGNDPLVFGIYRTIEALEAFVRRPVIFAEGSTTRERCKEAAALIEPELTKLEKDVADAKDIALARKEELAIAEQNLATFDAQQEEARQEELRQREARHENGQLGRGRRERTANRRYQQAEEEDVNANADADNADAESNNERTERVEAVDVKRAASASADASVVVEEAKLADFKKKYGDVLTEEDFAEYAKKCVEVAFVKYNNLFTTDVHLVRARKALLACKVFDILFLRSGPSLDECYRLIDELVHFAFPEFDDEFIKRLKDELPTLLTLVNTINYNFEGEDAEKNKRLYHQRVKTRAKRASQRETLRNVDQHLREREGTGLGIFMDEDGEEEMEEALDIEGDDAPIGTIGDTVRAAGADEIGDDNFRIMDDWKQDVGERSRRMFDWWRMLMNERKGDITAFQEAVRLIATSQASSAAIERVFSQLTFIRRVVGDKTSSDVLQTRAFIRCHDDELLDSFDT